MNELIDEGNYIESKEVVWEYISNMGSFAEGIADDIGINVNQTSLAKLGEARYQGQFSKQIKDNKYVIDTHGCPIFSCAADGKFSHSGKPDALSVFGIASVELKASKQSKKRKASASSTQNSKRATGSGSVTASIHAESTGEQEECEQKDVVC
jgi:hypothetical protein